MDLFDPDTLLAAGQRIIAECQDAAYICAANEAAIPLAAASALLGKPSFYRRNFPKSHGNTLQYEGVAAEIGASVAVVGLDCESISVAADECGEMGYRIVARINLGR